MLCSQILSVLITGIANRIINRGKIFVTAKESNKIRLSLTKSLVEAVYDASKGMFSICSFVIAFSAVAGILSTVLDDGFVKTAVLSIFEVCTGVKTASSELPVWAVAFVAGFGGICVHFQIFSVLGNLLQNYSRNINRTFHLYRYADILRYQKRIFRRYGFRQFRFRRHGIFGNCTYGADDLLFIFT